MRDARLAEAILSLVAPRERAASAVGDLLETRGASSAVWFWASVAQLTLSLLRGQVAAAPIAMLASAVVGWFVYMALSLVLAFAGVVLTGVLWGLLYLGVHHTGLELVAAAARLRDWHPLETVYWAQLVAMCMAAPYLVGRLAARGWPGRELAVSMVFVVVWSVMAMATPLVLLPGSWSPHGQPEIRIATGTSASLLAIPLMLLFVLSGALRERRVSASAP